MLITPSGKLYVCKQCDESFDKSYSLANHVKSFCPKRVKKTDGDNADTKGEQGEAGIIRLIGSCGIYHINCKCYLTLTQSSKEEL